MGGRRRLKIQTSGATALDVSDIKCDQVAVTAAVDGAASARYKHLKYLNVVLTGKLPEGSHQATLRISTNVSGAEHLEIPVTIEVPQR